MASPNDLEIIPQTISLVNVVRDRCELRNDRLKESSVKELVVKFNMTIMKWMKVWSHPNMVLFGIYICFPVPKLAEYGASYSKKALLNKSDFG